ncbi:MAG: LysM peptidoglycan-binding domain-containing protein, partial [Caldilineaceae bacterium]|nr:LysM peptidoglycan-binding domain-containing protein [Caldilineaceae bacterium]
MSEIAQYYQVSLTRLMLFNGIVDANSVVAGQELTIPTSNVPSTATPIATATLESPTATATPTVIATPPSAPTLAQTPTGVSDGPTSAPAASFPVSSSTAAEDETGKEAVDGPFTTVLTAQDITTDPTLVAGAIASLNHTYTVREGDTFARIALRTGVDPEALRQLNRLDPDHLNDLYICQTLLLPATGDDLRVQRALSEYVVEPGDSLGSIANKFDLSLADLLAANFIADPDSLAVGQHLTIPQPTA